MSVIQIEFPLTETFQKYIRYNTKNKKVFSVDTNNIYFHLGEGSYGIVNMFYNRKEDVIYIVKRVVDTGDGIDKLLREVSILNILYKYCNKYIICYNLIYNIHELGNNNYELQFAMEFAGNSLKSYVDENRKVMNVKDKLIIMINLLDGLQYLNSLGFVHRDVKLDNIVVDSENINIKYIDFGGVCLKPHLVKKYMKNVNNTELMLSEDDMYDCLSSYTGTPYYMSPELVNRNINSWEDWALSDIWSLGVTFYYLITDRKSVV